MSIKITTRAEKGIALSIQEMDGNLTTLRDAIAAARAGELPAAEIETSAGTPTGLYLPVHIGGVKRKIILLNDSDAAFTLTGVSPSDASTAGGETLTVTGSGFAAPTAALRAVNGSLTALTPTNVTATSFDVVMPAVAAGTYSLDVTDTGLTLSITNAVIVTAPSGGDATVEYDPTTDILLKQDTLQYTVENDAYIGPASNGHKLQYPKSVNGSPTESQVPNIEPWSVVLDPTGGDAAYPIAIRQNYKTVLPAITAGTWPVGTGDGQCGVEGLFFGATEMGDPNIGGQPGYEFWFSFRRRWSPGFRWSAFDPTTVTPNNIRQHNYKEFLVYREPFGGAQGRTGTFALDESGVEVNGSSAEGDFPTAPSQMWVIITEPDSASTTRPGATRYGQNFNNQVKGVDKSPNAVSDGQIHTFVHRFRNESFSGAGDGLIEMYVDGLIVIRADGLDASNEKTYKRVWTRVRPWRSAQHGPIVNGGAVQDQTAWIIGPYLAYQKPGFSS